jgi:hypothetical protein
MNPLGVRCKALAGPEQFRLERTQMRIRPQDSLLRNRGYMIHTQRLITINFLNCIGRYAESGSIGGITYDMSSSVIPIFCSLKQTRSRSIFGGGAIGLHEAQSFHLFNQKLQI